MKPQMGIFIIRSNSSAKCYLETTQNIKGTINGMKFRLESGSHRNKELQKDWIEYGKTKFIIEVLETLEYDENESKSDYSEELLLLKMIWEVRLSKDGMEFYIK